jgi:hypothetical protein
MHIGYWWKARRIETLGRPKCRWVDNIKMDLREIGWDDMDSCERGNEPSGSTKCWEVLE